MLYEESDHEHSCTLGKFGGGAGGSKVSIKSDFWGEPVSLRGEPSELGGLVHPPRPCVYNDKNREINK